MFYHKIHNGFFPFYTGIDFRMKRVEVDGKKVRIQLWYDFYCVSYKFILYILQLKIIIKTVSKW